MSALTLYFLVMLDSIRTFMGIMCTISWFSIIIYFFVMTVKADCENNENASKSWRRCLKIGVPIMIVITFISVMIPSTKQVAFIYIASTLSQNKVVQDIGNRSLQIPDKALEILNVKMNEYLDDMKKEAISEVKQTTNEVKKEIKK